ncbi:nucleotide exchange factor GrpE [Lutimonas zeaxanthinifaciens]|uniref:nucleotide exchange factor GrpE n=1 Tax=Lutimonas zeaxanthinifaciens TaxID=3060215 RepID=UPI00265CF417|nr:nucleotide exchange factor GrpE [Lutimonas sp. YSD2104]WKK64860.1 nucleotide exchange factor GrpE [Lutimonas sp. YSD2104]
MSDQKHTEKELEKDIPQNEVENETLNEGDDNKPAEKSEEKKEEVSEVDALKAEVQKEKDNFLRLFAEFENYKKRTSRERIELFSTANKELMTALLPILDDFERGLKEVEKSSDKALLEGMQLIYNKFKNTLSQKGLKEMEVKQGDSFDAEIHEAISQIPAPNKKLKGKIIDAVEKGYKLGETIIRYPKVVIGN